MEILLEKVSKIFNESSTWASCPSWGECNNRGDEGWFAHGYGRPGERQIEHPFNAREVSWSLSFP